MYTLFISTTLLALSNLVFASQPVQLKTEDLDKFKVPVIVSPQTQAKLGSPLTGFVEKIYLKAGNTFKKDEPLLDFDCTVLAAEKEKAQNVLTHLQKRSQGMDRLLRLDGANQMDVAEAKEKFLSAQQTLTIKSYLLSKCHVVGPFDGQIIDLKTHAHEYIAQGKPLMNVVSLEDIELSLILPSEWLSWLKVGTEFSVDLNETPGHFTAKIDRFVYSIDPVSKTITAYGTFTSKDPNIKPGMSGNAQFKRP